MNRDRAAVPPAETTVLDHNLDGLVDEEVLANEDVSRETSGGGRQRRLFDERKVAMSKELLTEKIRVFEQAQKSGHTPIIQVVSFADEYLRLMQVFARHQNGSPKKTAAKKPISVRVDDAKLRVSLRRAIHKMAKRAGFSKMAYVGAIHGNTEHLHAHLAMIETDDDASWRLAARHEANDSAEQVVKFKAARQMDRKRGAADTVERGMMRQSEMDYFRQEIDDCLKNLASLEPMRDLEKQRTYAAIVRQDVMRQARHSKQFVQDFIGIYERLEDGFSTRKDANQALDVTVEKLSRELLSGQDFGQADYFKAQLALGQQLALDHHLKESLKKHEQDAISDDIRADYQTMGLDPSKYNGMVQTPVEFSEAHPKTNGWTLQQYALQYQRFINKPSIANLDHLVVKDQTELEDPAFLREFMAIKDQELVESVKDTVYQLLVDAKERQLDNKQTAKALGQSLKQLPDSKHVEKGGIKSRLNARSIRPDIVDEALLKALDSASQARILKEVPRDIRLAQDFLKENYQESLDDLDAMMMISKGKKLPKEKRQKLYESSRDLREQILGKGDLTKAGSMLHAALAAEVANTGALKRVHKLKVGQSNELFLAYEQHTAEKLAASKALVADLKQNEASEPSGKETQLRESLGETLTAVAEGYQSRIEYVQMLKEISQMPDKKERDALAQLQLDQALRRQGVDENKSFEEIEQSIEDHSKWSAEDKLATAMSLHLKESQTLIESKRAEALIQAKELEASHREEGQRFDASKALQKEVLKQSMADVLDQVDVAKLTKPAKQNDVLYHPIKYKLMIDNKPLLKGDASLTALKLSKVAGLQKKQPLIPKTADELKAARITSQKTRPHAAILQEKIHQDYLKKTDEPLYSKQQQLSNVSDHQIQYDLDQWQRRQAVPSVKRTVVQADKKPVKAVKATDSRKDKQTEQGLSR